MIRWYCVSDPRGYLFPETISERQGQCWRKAQDVYNVYRFQKSEDWKKNAAEARKDGYKTVEVIVRAEIDYQPIEVRVRDIERGQAIPGTIISRTHTSAGNRVRWVLKVGAIREPKREYHGDTIHECLDQAEDWLYKPHKRGIDHFTE